MSIRTAVISLALAATCAGAQPAFAQTFPGDTGSGVERGMQELNTSGQVGTVTLFAMGPNKTRVVINLKSVPAGRREPAHIHRSRDCDTIDAKPAFDLNVVVRGFSATVVNVAESRLLSGNYSVIVHSSDAKGAKYVSCGHLY